MQSFVIVLILITRIILTITTLDKCLFFIAYAKTLLCVNKIVATDCNGKRRYSRPATKELSNLQECKYGN